MKKNKIRILGKEYLFQSDFDEKQLKESEKKIEERIKHYESQYPNADKIDLLVVFIFELLENIYIKEKQICEREKKLENLKGKLEIMEKNIKEKLNILTKEIQ